MISNDPSRGRRVLKFDAYGRLKEEQRGGARLGYEYDKLGNLAKRTTPTGVERTQHDAFGRISKIEGPSGGLSFLYDSAGRLSRVTNIRLRQRVDYDYRARTYDPELGRFTTPDPSGRQGGLNLYAYVENAPTVLNDPTGLFPSISVHNPLDALGDLADGAGDLAGSVGDAVVDVAKGTYNLGERAVSTVADFGIAYGRLRIAFERGFLEGVWSGLHGTYTMVRHPMDTLKGLLFAATHPGEIASSVGSLAREYGDAALHDREKFARM